MNPRVSRSSALASKATGFPIAKIAAKLAVGYTLDEVVNDITVATPASFEPALDYVVVKVPRFDSAKFPSITGELGTSMQSVGEAMAIGRTFPEALQKALRSLETGRAGLNADTGERNLLALDDAALLDELRTPTPDRVFQLGEALRRGFEVDRLAGSTGIDPWFVDQMAEVVDMRREIEAAGEPEPGLALRARRMGYSGAQLAYLWGLAPGDVRDLMSGWGIEVTYKTVDTCAAEFDAETPYFYSTLRTGERGAARRAADGDRARLGAQPDRTRHRIRLLLCARHLRLARRRVSVGHDQLQSRDGVNRL